MIRARAGGGGQRFNLGEAAVTRCTVALAGGQAGTGYTIGRSRCKAEIIALLDALLQDGDYHGLIREKVLAPLKARQARAREEEGRRTAATKVDFYYHGQGRGLKMLNTAQILQAFRTRSWTPSRFSWPP